MKKKKYLKTKKLWMRTLKRKYKKDPTLIKEYLTAVGNLYYLPYIKWQSPYIHAEITLFRKINRK